MNSREKLAAEIAVLEAEKSELGMELLIARDKLKQQREENGRMVAEVQAYQERLNKATQASCCPLLPTVAEECAL